MLTLEAERSSHTGESAAYVKTDISTPIIHVDTNNLLPAQILYCHQWWKQMWNIFLIPTDVLKSDIPFKPFYFEL